MRIRPGFLVLAVLVGALDVGFWWFARGQHQSTARIGFLVAFVALLALLAVAAGLVRWEVAVPLGAASTSGLLFVGAAAIFSVGFGFLLLAVIEAALVRRLVVDDSPSGWRDGTGVISSAAAVVPVALFAIGLFALR
ncbi:uncharacterized SAM-binding protein YcdF (DUF218 family) [Amycolatopsis lexingtonensis]|uniref:Uncharacterized SAM-binding protein YcdF (DUF218 family) n=1 Tax=Amycolatopsis lexingtonensis TaxID=218822 RepID=A0ABR9I4G2_9PSEU|nr:hypothetical protein [Amycolatopsis lexingtonensis]MBE1498064.1 uncharacterized SAM-binding protein YcdF (DUF218 family) [Amycolatopsis lexingtonensis]